MAVTVLFTLIISLGGSLLTYLYSSQESLPVRLCAGNIIGSTIFALAGFLFACAFGMNPLTIALTLIVALLPLALLLKRKNRKRLGADWREFWAGESKKWVEVAFYAALLILFYFFFSQAMIYKPEGIFTGSSHNTGDLPFHLGAIFSFTDGQNFPPENPSFADAKFTYPFMTDLATAFLVRLGADVREVIVWQDITLAFSLFIIFENFVYRITKNAFAAKLGVFILMFSGGLGFVIFFRDYWHDGRTLSEVLWHLPGDYTIRDTNVRWGNPLTTLLLTQRSFLLGMPITLIVLTYLWRVFSGEKAVSEDLEISRSSELAAESQLPVSAIFIGLLAGTLPLIHVHSLLVLFVVAALLFAFDISKWRIWVTFGVATAVIAIPELAWAMSGSATHLAKFIDWNFGWDARGANVIIFWAKNLGLFFPLLVGAFMYLRKLEASNHLGMEENDSLAIRPQKYLLFYVPFLLCFIISNTVKLAPWEWDNIKVLIYWFIGSVPFVAWFLAIIWKKSMPYKMLFAASLILLMLSGGIDIWRVLSHQINYQVFNRDGMAVAEQIKQKTVPNALFLNAPTYNSAVVLSGRRSFMRYLGHLSSYGIDYEPRLAEVQRVYEGTALADTILKENNIEYVIVSPEETGNLEVNEDYFKKFPVIAESGEYRVYQVK